MAGFARARAGRRRGHRRRSVARARGAEAERRARGPCGRRALARSDLPPRARHRAARPLRPRRAAAEEVGKRGAVLVITTWIVTSIVFRVYVSSIANFKTAVGQLTV